MTVLIRTSDVPPAQRYDAWRNAVCDTLGPLDMRSDPDVPLQGEIGGSSSAALALAAAARNPRVSRVVAREPP